MDAFTQAFLVFCGMIACLGVGYHLGFDLGKKHVMTKKQAASILAKASHKNRAHVTLQPTGSFVRYTR